MSDPSRLSFGPLLPVLAIALASCAAGCGKVAQVQESSELDGKWGWVSGEGNGKVMLFAPAASWRHFSRKGLIENLNGQTVVATIHVDSSATPKRFDVNWFDRSEYGIYRVDGDILTLCWADSEQLRPTEFRTSTGDLRTLVIYHRMYPEKLSAPVSEKEAQELVDRVQSAMKSGDAAKINSEVDWDGMMQSATIGFGIPEGRRLSFIHGWKENSKLSSQGIGGPIAGTIAKGGRCDLLRIATATNRTRVFFRLIPAIDTIAYFELLLGRDAYGETKIVDCNPGNGDLVSATLRRALLPFLAPLSPDFSQNASASDKEYIVCNDQLAKLGECYANRQFDDAAKIYRSLPTTVQREKWMLLMRLNSDEVHRKDILEECQGLYPDDPALAIFNLTYYANAKQYQRVLQVIDALDRTIGGDPYLDFLRAKYLLADDNVDRAKDAAQRAIDTDPTLSPAYTILASIYLKRNEFDQAANLLKSYQARFGGLPSGIANLENYDKFLNSSEYHKWHSTFK